MNRLNYPAAFNQYEGKDIGISLINDAKNQRIYKSDVAGQIGCLPEDIQLSPAPNHPVFGGTADIMYAECKGVTYLCSNGGSSCSVAK